MAIIAYIQDREVVASGVLVFFRTDQSARVQIDNLAFEFSFIHDPGLVAVDPELIGQNTIRLRFTGRLSGLPISYELPNVGFWNGNSLHLACMARAVEDGGFVVREITYTFTATPMPQRPPPREPPRRLGGV